MARILAVSYDESLLQTRELLLRSNGHDVVSARGFTDALTQCNSRTGFNLLILGHSIPYSDKEAIIDAFRDRCPGVVVALKRYGEEPVQSADYEIEPDPENLLKLLAQVTSSERGTPRQPASLPRSA